jgi:hypothetical protein
MRNHAAAILATRRPVSARDVLARRCEDLVAAEVARLARRTPPLNGDQLAEVAAALRRVAGQLVLARTNAISDGELAVLFDLAGAPDQPPCRARRAAGPLGRAGRLPGAGRRPGAVLPGRRVRPCAAASSRRQGCLRCPVAADCLAWRCGRRSPRESGAAPRRPNAACCAAHSPRLPGAMPWRDQ